MRDILKNGMLDEKLNNLVHNFRVNYKEFYNIIYSFNDICYLMRNDISNFELDLEDKYIFTNFVQIHNSFQSYITLMERGMLDESYSILRTMYDKLINQQMVATNKKEYNNVILQKYYLEKRNMYSYIKKHGLTDIISKKDAINGIIECNKNILKNENGEEIKPNQKQNAIDCKMVREYFYFKYLSGYVHNDLRCLLNMYSEDENGVYINGSFRFEKIENQIIMGLSCLNKSMKLIDKRFFKNKYKDDIEKLNQKEYELTKKEEE